MATRTTERDTTDFVSPEELHFDLSNPRFADAEPFATEEDIVRYLTQHVDVDELLQSIRSAGYVDFEPLIVQRESRIVLEGNRRLAALRLLSDASLRSKLRVPLPEVDDPKALPDRVRVKWVDNRTDARAFIGFKHINGPFKWDALAKGPIRGRVVRERREHRDDQPHPRRQPQHRAPTSQRMVRPQAGERKRFRQGGSFQTPFRVLSSLHGPDPPVRTRVPGVETRGLVGTATTGPGSS